MKRRNLAEDINESRDYYLSQVRAEGNPFLECFWMTSVSLWFNWLMQAVIVSNTVVLALDRDPISDQEYALLERLNLIFTLVFVVEILIKIIGLSLPILVRDPFNVFDLVIVFLSLVDLAITYSPLGKSSILLTVRAFRLLKIFKLGKGWPTFRNLLSTIAKTLLDVKNSILLLFLFIYIYSLIGVALFRNEVTLNKEGKID